jgi:hypothetical protein
MSINCILEIRPYFDREYEIAYLRFIQRKLGSTTVVVCLESESKHEKTTYRCPNFIHV